jgi:two-component system, response regulator YesN
MLRLFLADDNSLARSALSSSPVWKQNSCEIVGEAGNGIEALDGIRKLKPDLAVLDIKMPGMDGLEVIRQLRMENHSCIYIILTGYDEFSFAQQSVKLGVFDFLLKPVSCQDLQSALSKVKHYIRGQKHTEKKMASLEKYADDYRLQLNNSPEERTRLFLQSLKGNARAAGKLYESLAPGLSDALYCIMLIASDTAGEDSEEWQILHFKEYEEAVLKEVASETKSIFTGLLTKEGYTVLLFPGQKKNSACAAAATEIADMVLSRNRSSGHSITIGLSSTSRESVQIQKMFRQAVFTSENHFFLNEQSVFSYENIHSETNTNDYVLLEKLNGLNEIIKKQPEKTTAYIDGLLSALSRSQEYNATFIKNIFIHIGIILSEAASEKGIAVKSIHEIVSDVYRMQYFTQLKEWVSAYACLLQSALLQNSCRSPAARNILDFLNNHYPEKISLQDVAAYVQLSVSQISRILKAETGTTYNVLLNKIRIQAAVHLLKEGRKKVYEIADAVGFSNYAYFYQLFKKETGVPPTEYKAD